MKYFVLVLLALSLFMSGCSESSYPIKQKHGEVSQYMCADNGGWNYSNITNERDRMDIFCNDGATYVVGYLYPNGVGGVREYNIVGNADEVINKTVDSIMNGDK
jgi:hypothetical protein